MTSIRALAAFLVTGGMLAAQTVFAVSLTPELTAYLQLSYAQVSQLDVLQKALAAFVAEKEARSAQVEAELVDERARPELDATALGLRHVELEAIRRAIVESRRQLVSDSRIVLTDTQRRVVDELLSASSMTGLVREAECYRLITPRSRLSGFGVPNIIPIPVLSCRDGLPSIQLADYFDLTRDQSRALQSINAELARFTEEKHSRTVAVQLEVGVELRRDVPDPNAVGVRHLELEAIRRQIAAKEAETRKTVTELLTIRQRAAAARLAETREQMRLADQATCAALVTPAPTLVVGRLLPDFTGCGATVFIYDPLAGFN